jgi:hypothetical protein
VRKIDRTSVVHALPNVAFSRLHEDLLGIDERAGYCYSLNASAARIWELAAYPVSVEEVCSILCAEFDIDSLTCAREVIEFLSAMRESGLVGIIDAASV